MKDELHFNLNAPITEHLRNRCGGVKADQEYEPTLRIIELEDDLWPSIECPVEFKLNEAAFLACLLNGVEADATSSLAVQKYLLVKKSTLMEGNFNFQPRHPGSSTSVLGASLYNCSVVNIPLKPPNETSLSKILSHPEQMLGRRVDALPAPGNVTSTWQRSEHPLVFRSLESPRWTNEQRTCTLPRY
ncbi:uncharacterized protein LOC8037238 [Ixodes scapularis]|uniref:uncharacterized protein LOC8037238 n=1 Tax=Ixodes scapularis TaxID=6945 RepID=UPI001C382B93|nr:uncharacterized protein LOC8037238 [Ixodes scapularis]